MGASKSTPQEGKVKTKATGKHTPLPDDVEPYQGPSLECLLITVPVEMSGHFVSGFSAGKTAVSSNVDAYYPTLAGYLEQGYKLNTFYRVPGAAGTAGFGPFGKHQYSFEALYSRPLGGFGVTLGQESSRLLVEKSIMHLEVYSGGILSIAKPCGTVADTSDIMNKIIHHSSNGGRLICLEINGNVVTRGMSECPGFGVDVLFEIPSQPSPAKYVYQVINVPIGFTVKMGFPTNRAEVHCDWLGTLTSHLNQGWKLVEIFLDQSEQHAGGFSSGVSYNSTWFFEKQCSKMQDPTPMYEGAVIEYYHKVAQSFTGTSVKTDWSPVIVEMGRRGWELACIQETPEYQAGLGAVKIKLIMFFQRKIVAGGGMMAPPPYSWPSPAIHPPDQPQEEPNPLVNHKKTLPVATLVSQVNN